MKPGDVVQLKSGDGPMLVVGQVATSDALVFYHDLDLVLREMSLPLVCLREAQQTAPADESTFGIPEALMKAKDAEAEAMRAHVEAQWAEDQVRYAHTSGYVQDEAPLAGVTRQSDG